MKHAHLFLKLDLDSRKEQQHILKAQYELTPSQIKFKKPTRYSCPSSLVPESPLS